MIHCDFFVSSSTSSTNGMSVFCIIVLVCEYAVSSLVPEQDIDWEQTYRKCSYKAPCYSFSIGILLSIF